MEWPTPGLWPGPVGLKASASPSMLWYTWLGLAIALFGVLFTMFTALEEAAFGGWMLCLKFLPSVGNSSWDKTNNTKSKQVRMKCAMDKMWGWESKQRRQKKLSLRAKGRKGGKDGCLGKELKEAWYLKGHHLHGIYRPWKGEAYVPNPEGKFKKEKE